MASSNLPTTVASQPAEPSPTPLPDAPSPTIDARLVVGSALFGVGWGIAGYCPGPALANLSQATVEAAVFVVALLAGSLLCRHLLPQ